MTVVTKLEHIGQHHFVNLHGGRKAFHGLTTKQVCHRYVIPHTLAEKQSLVDCVERSDPDSHIYVRRATWFVSHAWDYLFLDVVDALDYFMDEQDMPSDKASAGLWFCLFNNNQHEVMEKPFLHWFTTFKTALTAIGNVVMVFSPWNNPTTLTRTWCVFEVFVAIECNARFEVAMGKSEKETCLKHIEEGGVFETMVAKINCANSTTTFPSDRAHIFDLIKEGPGFEKLDRMVFDALEAWVVRTLEAQISLPLTDEERVKWLIVKGEMLFTKGAFEDAEDIFRSAVVVHGDFDKKPMQHWRAIACLANTKQTIHTTQWELLFLEALAHQKKYLGQSHAHTLETMRLLGEAYCYIKEHSFGMALLRKVLALQSGRSKEYIRTTFSLGRTLMNQKRLVEALQLPEEAYGTSKTTFGDYHMTTHVVGIHLAKCNASQGQFTSASQILENVYRLQLRILAPGNLPTMINLRALCVNRCFQGRYKNLEQNLFKCHDGFLALQRDDWAADCQRAFGLLYLCLWGHMRARVALDTTYAKFKDIFGPASTSARIIVFLRFFVAMECPEEVNSMDKIESLEVLLEDANLVHETWTEHPCHGCFEPIQGTLYMCPTCPRHSLRYCYACVTDKKYEATCDHGPTEWICRMPPARFLLCARLSLLSQRAMWIDYGAFFQVYEDYCDLYAVPNRVEDVRPKVVIKTRHIMVCTGAQYLCWCGANDRTFYL
ncbi:Aste57867_15695 [Aphanomyces stellatus]|uniref:Aste57867_15695 protein n=1 Tax=Aphanomyces stellatus TaxID=120398 RepID=A0A485L3N4_9STRA|nr:hypothetical protein As57867_015639 [Aphanomyces stellatus]VFT92487.1 Aste57867_15695 [Aphanomyces stellatus]